MSKYVIKSGGFYVGKPNPKYNNQAKTENINEAIRFDYQTASMMVTIGGRPTMAEIVEVKD